MLSWGPGAVAGVGDGGRGRGRLHGGGLWRWPDLAQPRSGSRRPAWSFSSAVALTGVVNHDWRHMWRWCLAGPLAIGGDEQACGTTRKITIG
jgi:hypothetical protein